MVNSGDPPTRVVCKNCSNAGDTDNNFCPECGEEDPWTEEYKYVFDDDDLPLIFSFETYNDNYELWDAFCEQYFGARLNGSEIKNLPDEFPRLEYCVVEMYWGITEDYEAEGPFLSRSAAREEVYGE